MGISKFNKGSKIDWKVNTEGWDFKKLSELVAGQEYPLKGCFTTPDTGYGVGAVLISDGFLVNIPARYVEDVKAIMSDAETIECIIAGKCAFKYDTFISEKYKRTGYSVEFIDK